MNEDTSNVVSVYVGGLSFNATTDEDMLREAFSEFGTITNVKLIDRETPDRNDPSRMRRSKFAFVEFTGETKEDSQAMAEAAIAGLNGKELDGRNIVVNIAEEKKPREGGFGGGNRGGGGFRPRDGGDRGGSNRWA